MLLAGMVLLVAYSGLMFWLGAVGGRLAEQRRGQGISPEWARQVRLYLTRLLEPPADDAGLDDMVVLPQRFKDDGRKLLHAAPGAAGDRSRREHGI